MAKIINIEMSPGLTDEVINVAATVGANGVNLQEDVIVVQALLKYTLERLSDFSDVKFPEPTGGDIRTTTQIIKKFQRYNNRGEKQTVSIDGRIDPIKGIYAHGTNKYWTLYALHSKAREISLLSGSAPPVEAICRRWSAVKAALVNGVGSLGLALE